MYFVFFSLQIDNSIIWHSILSINLVSMLRISMRRKDFLIALYFEKGESINFLHKENVSCLTFFSKCYLLWVHQFTSFVHIKRNIQRKPLSFSPHQDGSMPYWLQWKKYMNGINKKKPIGRRGNDVFRPESGTNLLPMLNKDTKSALK